MTWNNLDGKTLTQVHKEQNAEAESARQQALAEATRKQFEAYMNQYSPPITAANTYGNVAGSPPKPTSITISLETFQNMQIESGKELLSALSVMMRMEGIDVAEADKITIEIGDEVKVSAIPAPVKYTVKVDTDGYVSGFDSGYAKAAQYMADNMDKLILDSIRNENKS